MPITLETMIDFSNMRRKLYLDYAEKMEKEVTEKKNTVSQEAIEYIIDTAITEEAVFWGKELVVSYKLQNGFTVLGRGACVDPKNFDIEVGRKCAREMAINKLWELEGYLLQNKLWESGELR